MIKSSKFHKVFPSLVAIVFGLIIGVLLLVFTKPNDMASSIPKFFLGPLNDGLTGTGNWFYYSVPVLMTGLSVGFAFQTGLFNIGASGQFLVGAFATVLFCFYFTDKIPSSVLWIFGLIVGGLAGAFWASIVGILKAYKNVNEVITSIMLNYIAMYLINDLVSTFGIYNQLTNQTYPLTVAIPKFGLDFIFPGTISNASVIIAVIIAIILHFILHKTTFGFELKGVGLNRNAARYAGINEKKSIVLSMIIAGALSGLAGSMLMLSGAGNAITVTDVLPSQGFDGIAIALLGVSEPIGIIFSGLLIGWLEMGGQAIQTLGFAPEMISMIIAIILYVSALSLFFKKLIVKFEKNKEKKQKQLLDNKSDNDSNLTNNKN